MLDLVPSVVKTLVMMPTPRRLDCPLRPERFNPPVDRGGAIDRVGHDSGDLGPPIAVQRLLAGTEQVRQSLDCR